jgi:RHS repeat-associated protein
MVDGRGRRVGKKVNGVMVQGFVYGSELAPAAELDGNGNLVARFAYGKKVNVPEYLVKGGVPYRVITDHLGSVRLVVDAATGTVAQRMDYDEWGNVIVDTNAGFQPFAFAGGLYEAATELVRFGARDYDAVAARWNSKDPIMFRGRSTNLYRYGVADPVNRTDPTGLEIAPGRPPSLPLDILDELFNPPCDPTDPKCSGGFFKKARDDAKEFWDRIERMCHAKKRDDLDRALPTMTDDKLRDLDPRIDEAFLRAQ